jgi:hypothetical protein
MRKLLALFILVVVFLPLAIAAMSLTSIRPWVLDRSFYQRMVSDPRLYETMFSGEWSNPFNRVLLAGKDQLPLKSLNIALREVVTPDYLRAQGIKIIDQVFDVIDGRSKAAEVAIDITPIKAALVGEGSARFSTALAAALPACAVGQEQIAPGGTLSRCIPANSSVAEVTKQISGALPAAVANTPDRLPLSDPAALQGGWRSADWLLGGSVRSLLDTSIILVIFMTALALLVGAYLGGDDRRGRLGWLGISLLVPASLFVLMGLTMATPLIAGPIRDGLSASNWDGIQLGEPFRQAVTEMVIPVVQQIGNGFLLTGVISGLIAVGLLAWSWRVSGTVQQTGKMVQVPTRPV